MTADEPGIVPEDPTDEGMTVPEPTIEEVEPVHMLANEARPALRGKGFTDDEIDDWSRTFIAVNDGGSADDLIVWIASHEGGRPPS